MSASKHLIVDINTSRLLVIFLLVLHSLSLVSVLYLPLSSIVKAGVIVFIASSLVYCIKNTNRVRRVIASDSEEWYVENTDGYAGKMMFDNNAYISNGFIVLACKTDDRKLPFRILLMKDAVDKATFCQLKTMLKVL